jgi:hypothetical protein
MKIQFFPIKGKVVSHGDATGPKTKDGSNPKSQWKYSYLVLREDETGEEITIKDCNVRGSLNQYLTPGIHGTWLIGKAFGHNHLLAYRNDSSQTLDERISDKATPFGGVGAFIAVSICLILTGAGAVLGIPLLLWSLWAYARVGKFPKKIKDALIENGFSLQAGRTI